MSWWSKVLGLDEAPAQQGKQAKRSKKATPSKKEVSGKCDICNKPASTAKDGKVFTSIEMQRATKRGFNAYVSGGPARMLAMGGVGKDEASALWKQDVMRDAKDWLLCPRCQSKMRRYV
jgi:hypothetical protein